jgi:hypothetical protein
MLPSADWKTCSTNRQGLELPILQLPMIINHYCHDHPQAIPLFLQDKNNTLSIISTEFQPATAIGKRLIALDY